MLKKRIIKTRFITVICLIVFFLAQYFPLRNLTQSVRFGDESEHLTASYMMVTGRKILYRDLSTIHQPLPIFAGYIFWKIFRPVNFFMTIERVRQFMFLLSFAGALGLTLRFGAKGLIAAIIIESVKYYFFGYHLLAESLVVYPVMFIAGLLTEKNTGSKDDFFFGISMFLTAFNLLPAWPFLFLSFLFYSFKNKRFKNITAGFIIPATILFMLINPVHWYRETIRNNLYYFIPQQTAIRMPDIFSLAAYPFLSIFNLHREIGRFYFLLFTAVIAYILTIIKKKGLFLPRAGKLIYLYFLLILLNLRVTTMDIFFYTAFHALPQAAFLTVLAVFPVYKSYRKTLLLIAAAIFIVTSGWRTDAIKTDKSNQHFINYGDEESLGMAITAVKNNGDRLLAGEQSFLNISAGIPLSSKQISFLPWSFKVPELNSDLKKIMKESPPQFVFFPESNELYFSFLKPYLNKYYRKIKRSTGAKTDLYILNADIKINDQQWAEFESLKYKKPD